MLALLAWKNVWRNRKRSLIIITAITFGLWSGLLAGAIMMGWGESMVNSAIDRNLAHIQIHTPGFTRDPDVTRYIPGGMEMLQRIRAIPGVEAVSARTLVDGMAASPTSSFGVEIDGIDPAQAAKVTDIHSLIAAGGYFNGGGRNPVVIGKKLADRLSLKLRSKVVLSFQAMDGELVYAAFRVEGIFKSESSQFDESHVFVQQSDLFRLLGGSPVVHEIAVRAVGPSGLPRVVASLKSAYPQLSVQTWKELSPEIAFTAAAMESWSYLFVGIILMALVFGITNTMLMAVMERIRELGILTAIGMKRGKIFLMILLETIMMSFTGGICGMALGALTIRILSRTGVDLSAFASSLESFGTSTMLYPFLPVGMYAALLVMMIVASSIGAAMPAWKAIHLQPSRAIRTY